MLHNNNYINCQPLTRLLQMNWSAKPLASCEYWNLYTSDDVAAIALRSESLAASDTPTANSRTPLWRVKFASRARLAESDEGPSTMTKAHLGKLTRSGSDVAKTVERSRWMAAVMFL